MASRMVADKFYKPVGMSDGFVTDALPDGAVLYKHTYLNKRTEVACLELHYTDMHI